MEQQPDNVEQVQEVTIISDYPDDIDSESTQIESKTSFRLLKNETFSLFITIFIVFFAVVFFTYSAFFKGSKTELQTSQPEKEINYSLKIDLNTADAVMLELLPGVGPKIAERIIEYRDEHSGFGNIDELMNVKGISLRMLNTLRPFVYVEQTDKMVE